MMATRTAMIWLINMERVEKRRKYSPRRIVQRSKGIASRVGPPKEKKERNVINFEKGREGQKKK